MNDGATVQIIMGAFNLAALVVVGIRAERRGRSEPCDDGTDCFFPHDRAVLRCVHRNTARLCKHSGIEPQEASDAP